MMSFPFALFSLPLSLSALLSSFSDRTHRNPSFLRLFFDGPAEEKGEQHQHGLHAGCGDENAHGNRRSGAAEAQPVKEEAMGLNWRDRQRAAFLRKWGKRSGEKERKDESDLSSLLSSFSFLLSPFPSAIFKVIPPAGP